VSIPTARHMPEMLARSYVAYYISYALLQVGVGGLPHKPDKTCVTSVTRPVFCLTSPLTTR